MIFVPADPGNGPVMVEALRDAGFAAHGRSRTRAMFVVKVTCKPAQQQAAFDVATKIDAGVRVPYRS